MCVDRNVAARERRTRNGRDLSGRDREFSDGVELGLGIDDARVLDNDVIRGAIAYACETARVAPPAVMRSATENTPRLR